MKKQPISEKLHQMFIKPNARTEDDQRRAYIFNILICGTIVLAFLALLSEFVSRSILGTSDDTAPMIVMTAITMFFIGLWYFSKRGHYRYAAMIYLVAFFLFATYPLLVWGFVLPQGILTYCLIIVITGVLLSGRAAFAMTVVMILTLLFIERLGAAGVISFDTTWMKTSGGNQDIVVFAITFSIVALVSWLSNQQTEQSLHRARQSEKALRLERNLLEVRVRERTKELEQAQIEQLQELNRFAEFGRISSTLLHELANPLTSAILNLELIKGKRSSELYDQLHESIRFMEEYVRSARRQLRRESEISEFNVADEINRVIGFMQPKANAMQIEITSKLDKGLIISGDSVKFNQIISNLLANAIDAYESLLPQSSRPIEVMANANKHAICITVTDYGIGIPRKLIPHIFDPFYTTKLATRGTGLGLTITQRAVEEDFGGTISAASTKQSGTRFSIRIPMS